MLGSRTENNLIMRQKLMKAVLVLVPPLLKMQQKAPSLAVVLLVLKTKVLQQFQAVVQTLVNGKQRRVLGC